MFLDHKFGYAESLNPSTLPGYEKLTDRQRRRVIETYDRAYKISLHLGPKIASGKAHASAGVALQEELRANPKVEQPVPPSIFAGLENCQ